MSRRSQESRTATVRVTAGPEEPREQGQRRPPRARVWVVSVLLAVLVLLVAAAAYAVTFAPEQYASAQAVSADGEAASEVGGGVQLVPAKGWVVQPLVREIVEWPPLPPLHDWSVLLGESNGLLLLSPDHGIRVEVEVLSPGSERAARAWLRESVSKSDASGGRGADARDGADSGGEAVPGDGAETGDAADAGSGVRSGDSGDAAVRSETLASGFEVQHLDSDGVIAAVVETGSGWVTLRAEAFGSVAGKTAADTAANTGDKAAGNTAGGPEGQPLERYRPALSALLESIRAQ